MKNYAKLTEDKSKYITGLRDNEDGTLSVTFGDRRIHHDIENTEDNVKRIEAKMEEEMQAGIRREPEYVLRSIIATGSVIAAETGAVALKSIESLQRTELGQALTGAVLLVGSAITITWCIREWSRVSEISKVKYRNKHAEKFQNIDQYSHSLDGLKPATRGLFEAENPLSVINVDEYRKADLKKIVKEIAREEMMKDTLNITYVKTK